MRATAQYILAAVAVLPGFYGLVCWIRRSLNARKAAEWIKENHEEEWNDLHWLARRHPWAAIEALITKGLISGPVVDEYCTRDDYLEKASWLGLFISALLLLVILTLQYVAAIFE
jgi:hypothetical protein